MRKPSFAFATVCGALAASLLAFTAARADIISLQSPLSVAQTTDRFESAIASAGARVFTVIDFEKGAKSVGKTIRPTRKIIFGGPGIGAAAFSQAQTIGLELPLQVLVYEDEAGQSWIIYNDPADGASRHGLETDHPAVAAMRTALENMSAEATAEQ